MSHHRRAGRETSRTGAALAGALAAAAIVLSAPSGALAGAKPSSTLRVRNRTPFMLNIYVAAVRVGWIKPFRTETLTGLKPGYHEIYATSHYGSGQWGPRRLHVPGVWNVLPSEGTMSSSDTQVALVSRIYRANRASLQACDHLAGRRGEQLQGMRASIELRVDGDGRGDLTVKGEHVSEQLRSCYRAVGQRWQLPQTGEPYAVTFEHLHAAGR